VTLYVEIPVADAAKDNNLHAGTDLGSAGPRPS